MKLIENFNLLATAPDGIKRLRELILSLAVQGKLVPQDSNDEPASELLKQIRAEKQRLIAEGKIKKDKPLPAIGDDEKPFELPAGWEWVRFGTLFSLEYGDALPADKRSNTGEYPVYGSNGVVGSHDDAFVKHPCIVVGRKGSAGALNLCLLKGCVVTDVAYYCIPPIGIDLQFAFKMFHTLNLDILGKGIKPGLNRNEAYNLVVPVPPLAEQSRIVAKVEELMALCDALETRGQLEAEQHARLTATLFDALAASESAHQLQENWARLAANFDLVLDRPQAVDALEQTLLQLAVRGLLVPQDPADEPVSELLKQIRAEKDRLIAEGKIKKDKPLPAISEDEKPFGLPQGWEWTKAGAILDFLNGYAFKSDWFQSEGIRLLRNINVAHGSVNWAQTACLDANRMAEFERFVLRAGDLVLTLDRPIISTGLKYAMIREEDMPCLLLQRVARLAPISGGVNAKFVELWLNSELFFSSIDPGRSNGVPHISTKQIETVMFPLPPSPNKPASSPVLKPYARCAANYGSGWRPAAKLKPTLPRR